MNWAVSVTYTIAHGNTRSLTHWVGLEIESKTSKTLCQVLNLLSHSAISQGLFYFQKHISRGCSRVWGQAQAGTAIAWDWFPDVGEIRNRPTLVVGPSMWGRPGWLLAFPPRSGRESWNPPWDQGLGLSKSLSSNRDRLPGIEQGAGSQWVHVKAILLQSISCGLGGSLIHAGGCHAALTGRVWFPLSQPTTCCPRGGEVGVGSPGGLAVAVPWAGARPATSPGVWVFCW